MSENAHEFPWANAVPAVFPFALKAPEQITHYKRLKDSHDVLTKFLDVARTFKKRLGPLLFPLPPNVKKDALRLEAFLKLLPRRCRVAFEFRHASWFDDEVFELLSAHRAALCIADSGELEPPFVATTNWGCQRLRRSSYGAGTLKKRGKQVRQQDWQDVFAFFKYEDEAKGPKFAEHFLKLAT